MYQHECTKLQERILAKLQSQGAVWLTSAGVTCHVTTLHE